LVNRAPAKLRYSAAVRCFVASRFILRKAKTVMVNGRFSFLRDRTSQRRVNGLCDKVFAVGIWERGVQRKVFRIEQMSNSGAEQRKFVDELANQRGQSATRAGDDAIAAADLKRELASIRDAIARNKRELAMLIGEGKERRMARAGDELRAAVDGMDYATQKILKSVEVIDESARTLSATLKDEYKRGLSQDIQDQVAFIYEACNFQDIAGQRITNVMGTMNMIEDQVAAMLGRSEGAAATAPAKSSLGHGLLNGPKLEGDSGHADQSDIDAMFS
jgi:chemotaxis protein CheZ